MRTTLPTPPEAVSSGAGEAAADLAIRVDVEIPARRLAMTMSIRRNTDATLPATHTVEIVFNLRSDFAFGGVAGVLGLLMKDAHETRGVALSRLAVKVRKDFFLIGLSAVEADRQRNFMLLKERSWFDIPVVYDNGRRGIIAIEKGSEGGAAFEQALRRWHGEVHRHTDARQPSRLPPATQSNRADAEEERRTRGFAYTGEHLPGRQDDQAALVAPDSAKTCAAGLHSLRVTASMDLIGSPSVRGLGGLSIRDVTKRRRASLF
jgi:hypothetical protein